MADNTIKIVGEGKDRFVWKVVNDVAKEIFNSGVFPLFELHDDGSESLISDFEHLNEVLEDGGDIGIEVGFVNYKKVEELKRLIKSHDFAYMYSDDNKRYQEGKKSLERIHSLRDSVDKEEYVRLWNNSAPENFKFIKK